MPGKDGKLTQGERDKLFAWVNAKGKNHQCPVCLTNKWAFGEHLLHGQIYHGGNMVVGGANYPMAFMVCSNCAHVRTFMAVPIGIADYKEETPEVAAAPKPPGGRP
jgi:hypothetical protein